MEPVGLEGEFENVRINAKTDPGLLDFLPLPEGFFSLFQRGIEALADNPRPPGCEKLSGLPRYRIRQGQYRIVYEIRDDVLLVLVVKVAHRPRPFQPAAGSSMRPSSHLV